MLAASAGRAPGGELLVDVLFLETPHRLHLVLDAAAGTFTARWRSRICSPRSGSRYSRSMI